jgi:hypothetical protein
MFSPFKMNRIRPEFVAIWIIQVLHFFHNCWTTFCSRWTDGTFHAFRYNNCFWIHFCPFLWCNFFFFFFLSFFLNIILGFISFFITFRLIRSQSNMLLQFDKIRTKPVLDRDTHPSFFKLIHDLLVSGDITGCKGVLNISEQWMVIRHLEKVVSQHLLIK